MQPVSAKYDYKKLGDLVRATELIKITNWEQNEVAILCCVDSMQSKVVQLFEE